ncbi:hypothetical protein DdX_01977 [Ditylenchus destructor]|uniref:Uncharacterized protein n=1 Tax=Ditylenchus destructor TaxID=166010 RepID=A0AAD4NFA3_9BILA|nr:hypothetical protein DdX_01977 [Ditylenchus destructor]
MTRHNRIRHSVVKIDLDIRSPSSIVCCSSSLACVSFCANFETKEWNIKKKFIQFIHTRSKIDETKGIVLFVRLKSNNEYWIDKIWNRIVGECVKQCLLLERLMWNLSTLGGALSAMGDFIDTFADRALEVSLKQRKIAQLLDDPVLISRCNMYIGLSLAQKGKFTLSLRIIRHEYKLGQSIKSELITNCAQGLHTKITHARNKALNEKGRLKKYKQMS